MPDTRHVIDILFCSSLKFVGNNFRRIRSKRVRKQRRGCEISAECYTRENLFISLLAHLRWDTDGRLNYHSVAPKFRPPNFEHLSCTGQLFVCDARGNAFCIPCTGDNTLSGNRRAVEQSARTHIRIESGSLWGTGHDLATIWPRSGPDAIAIDAIHPLRLECGIANWNRGSSNRKRSRCSEEEQTCKPWFFELSTAVGVTCGEVSWGVRVAKYEGFDADERSLNDFRFSCLGGVSLGV